MKSKRNEKPEKGIKTIKVTCNDISDAIYYLNIIKETTDSFAGKSTGSTAITANIFNEAMNTALKSMELLKELMEMNRLDELCGSRPGIILKEDLNGKEKRGYKSKSNIY